MAKNMALLFTKEPQEEHNTRTCLKALTRNESFISFFCSFASFFLYFLFIRQLTDENTTVTVNINIDNLEILKAHFGTTNGPRINVYFHHARPRIESSINTVLVKCGWTITHYPPCSTGIALSKRRSFSIVQFYWNRQHFIIKQAANVFSNAYTSASRSKGIHIFTCWHGSANVTGTYFW